MVKETISQVKNLSVSEKLLLMEELWEDIAAHPEQVQLSESQKRELDRRYEEYKKNPGEGSSWADVKKRLLKSL